MLHAISPVDGRYQYKTESLSEFFSEYALIKYRLFIEIEYFKALVNQGIPQLVDFDKSLFPKLDAIVNDFDVNDAEMVKNLEKVTNHDVKAVEYIIKDQFKLLGIEQYAEFVHFGLTSQDINNTAFPLMIKDAISNVIFPEIEDTLNILRELSEDWMDVSMLARTHGQPASPTSLGKEIHVFVSRIEAEADRGDHYTHSGKFGGATGNLNAHFIAYPKMDWHGFAEKFMESIGLKRQYPTTQIEHYDGLAELFHHISRLNVILLDLCKDIWTYVSLDYFKQKIVADEVGSSAMPHKVNPIDFENAEGNLGIANALFTHLAQKLPISRLQRDLTDSTALRNVGVPFAHLLISLKSIQKGLGKLELNKDAIDEDLQKNYVVIAEAIQTILRREKVEGAYEKLKDFTRTANKLDKSAFDKFIAELDISDEIRLELLAISPFTYTGRN